jgi:hypothetical protein
MLSGIDLRRTADDRYYCFEMNPSPGKSRRVAVMNCGGEPMVVRFTSSLKIASSWPCKLIRVPCSQFQKRCFRRRRALVPPFPLEPQTGDVVASSITLVFNWATDLNKQVAFVGIKLQTADNSGCASGAETLPQSDSIDPLERSRRAKHARAPVHSRLRCERIRSTAAAWRSGLGLRAARRPSLTAGDYHASDRDVGGAPRSPRCSLGCPSAAVGPATERNRAHRIAWCPRAVRAPLLALVTAIVHAARTGR